MSGPSGSDVSAGGAKGIRVQEILDVKDSLKKHIAEAKGDGKEEKTTVENGLARRIVSGVMGLAAEAAEFYEEQ